MDRVAFRGFRFDGTDRSWSFRPAGKAAMRVESARAALRIGGQTCALRNADALRLLDRGVRGGVLGQRRVFACVSRFLKPAPFEWTLEFEVPIRGHVLIIGSRVANLSSGPLAIGALDLGAADLCLGRQPDKSVVYQFRFIDATMKEPSPGKPVKALPWGGNDTRVKRLDSDGGRHTADEILLVHNPAQGGTFLSGFITFDAVRPRHALRRAPGRGVAAYRAYVDFMGNELVPGHTFHAERLRIEMAGDPHRALESWADTVRRLHRPKVPKNVPVGWVGWSWADLLSGREAPAETVILKNVKAVRRRLSGFGVDYVWISLVNLKDMLPGNWLEFNRRHFPSGVPRVLRKLRAMGMIPGFWSAPFWVFGEACQAVRDNRDNFLRRRDGSTWSLRLGWPFTDIRPAADGRFDVKWLDGSDPRTLAYIRRVTRFYRRLGIRYYLLDFLCEPVGGVHRNPRMTWREAERAVVRAIKEAAGPDTVVVSGVGSGLHYLGSVDSMRVSSDYGEGRPLYPPFRDHLNATFALYDPLTSDQLNLLRNVAGNYFTHGTLYLNNANIITVDKPVPLRHAEITLTVFGLCGTPIMLGDDIRRIHEERLALIKKCLPQTSEAAFPLDLFQSVYPEDYPRVLVKRVRKPWETYCLLAVFNLDETLYRKRVPLGDLGLDRRAPHRIYDFWAEEYAGTVSGAVEVIVPPRSVKLLRVAPARPYPWLLSTDMHLQQGNVEIVGLSWNARTMTLSGVATRPRGESGNLYFLMPPRYRVPRHEGLWLMKDKRDGVVIVRKAIRFTEPEASWALRFAPLDTSGETP
jgi:hypothetical protein